jgi:hypothetical protein
MAGRITGFSSPIAYLSSSGPSWTYSKDSGDDEDEVVVEGNRKGVGDLRRFFPRFQ